MPSKRSVMRLSIGEDMMCLGRRGEQKVDFYLNADADFKGGWGHVEPQIWADGRLRIYENWRNSNKDYLPS